MKARWLKAKRENQEKKEEKKNHRNEWSSYRKNSLGEMMDSYVCWIITMSKSDDFLLCVSRFNLFFFLPSFTSLFGDKHRTDSAYDSFNRTSWPCIGKKLFFFFFFKNLEQHPGRQTTRKKIKGTVSTWQESKGLDDP